MTTFDAAALEILMDRSLTNREQQAKLQGLARLGARLVNGTIDCPECGDESPKDSSRCMGELEFCCGACGTQFLASEVS